MDNLSQLDTPLTYSQWVARLNSSLTSNTEAEYLSYLRQWYRAKNGLKNTLKSEKKESFIKLIKDLNFLFGDKNEDLLLKDIDFNNEEDLILIIPIFAKKLKEISKSISSKREVVKRAKTKYNLIGSNYGLEVLLRDYILRTFTKKEGQLTQIPTSIFQNLLPELSAVKNNFYLQVEELHDTQNYFDSDPSVNILDYINLSELTDGTPLRDEINPLDIKEIISVLQSRFLPKLSLDSIFNVFEDYLLNVNEESTRNIQNLTAASKKYLGENVYGLTAVRIEEVDKPDQLLTLKLKEGDNWFLWPSGFQVLTDNIYNNFFEPITIQNSSFLNSGATAGDSVENSDLIFTDKNGSLEGAWLQGTYTEEISGETQITLKTGEITEFLFPYVGFDVNSVGLTFEKHRLTEKDFKFFKALSETQQTAILKDYYTKSFPTSSNDPIYLNYTSLIEQGAYAGKFSHRTKNGQLIFDADVITKRTHTFTTPDNYSDSTNSETEQSFVYKFDRTDLPISRGLNNIHWPERVFQASENVSLNYTDKECLPVKLADIETRFAMKGAVAGLTIDTADIILKLNSRSDSTNPSEIAWLRSGSVNQLDRYHKGSIDVYGSLSAVFCQSYIEGPIQGSLSFRSGPGQRVSFVWHGPDTLAKEVFKYIPHEEDCEYGKKMPHNYFKKFDYVNPTSLTDSYKWKTCSCKAVHFSPIGHIGDRFSDHNAVTDYLYHDPLGLAENFSFNSWTDTRGLDYKNSPQFAYFQLDKTEGDSPVGFGAGRWKTSNKTLSPMGDEMVLKTGKRYTYYRSNLRMDVSNTPEQNLPPYLIVNYAYPVINGVMCDDENAYDIIIALDNSRSLTFDFEQIKNSLGKICTELITNKNKKTQIGLITFNYQTVEIGYLSNNGYELNLQLNGLKIPKGYPEYTTDIYSALKIAEYLLYTPISASTAENFRLAKLCSELNKTISDLAFFTRSFNRPQANAKKKIIIVSDGVETQNVGKAVELAKQIKAKGTEIVSISCGELSKTNNLMETIATSYKTHFNLYKYIESGDGNYESFISYLAPRLNGCRPYQPVWVKGIVDILGNYITTEEDYSDMVLNPGDYLVYNHQSQVLYSEPETLRTFSTEGVNFSINVKLDGWDYISNTFSPENIGPEYGAKPFWGKLPNNPKPYAGNVRFVLDYVPIHQPDVSDTVLFSGDYLTYTRIGLKDLNWIQPLDFKEIKQINAWKQLSFNKVESNLQEFLLSGPDNLIMNPTNNNSNLLLEGYSNYKAAKYHYVARKDFTYTEKLYNKNRCVENFVLLNSALIIQPDEPYSNLQNRFYPTVATVSFPEKAVTEKEVGGYLLPENLGVSTYRGRGYKYGLDSNSLSSFNALSGEYVYLDTEKYGNRNRGLTKKDQKMPTKLLEINNNWIVEPYSSGEKAGTITGSLENQKFTPYQTSYETDGFNLYGLVRQEDSDQFWDFSKDEASWKDKGAKTNFSKDLADGTYQDKIYKLLTNKGSMVQWRSDVFGNDYGLFKFVPPDADNPMNVYITLIPPVFTKQPEYLAQQDYLTNVTLSVAASGSDPISYQWYKDGNRLQNGSGPSYTIYKALPQDEGIYYCYIANEVGWARSNNVIINFGLVYDPNQVYSLTPVMTSNKMGSTIVYNVSTRNVPNGTTLQWTNDGSMPANYFTDNLNKGVVIINNNKAVINRTLVKHITIKEPMTLVMRLRTDNITAITLATAELVVIQP